jgi:hypothetical protein
MRQLAFALVLFTFFASRTVAQNSDNGAFPRLEGFAGYTGVLTGFVLIKTGPGSSGQTDLDSAAGFEGAIIGNVNKVLGIKGDASMHFGRYKEPDFTVPCGLPACPTQLANSHTRMFNFLVGPELKLRNHTRATPFADGLFGITHTSTAFSTSGAALNFSGSTGDTGFGMAFGGGLDVRITRRISFRFSSDYDLACGQTGPGGSSKTLNSWRFSFGALFH